MFEGNKPKCQNGHEMRVRQTCSCKKGQLEKCYRCHLESYHKSLRDPKDGGRKVKQQPPTIP